MRKLALFALVLTFPASAGAEVVNLAPVHFSGFSNRIYEGSASSSPAFVGTNAGAVGTVIYRSFAVFDLAGLDHPIIGLNLSFALSEVYHRLSHAEYPWELSVVLGKPGVDAATLMAGADAIPGVNPSDRAKALWDELDGSVYGGGLLTDLDRSLDATLSASAIADANAALAADGRFVVSFSAPYLSYEQPGMPDLLRAVIANPTLTVTLTNPEPTSLVLIALGLPGLWWLRRR